MVFLWNSYTAASSTRVRNSQLDATTEQNADLNPEWLELRTTVHVVQGYARRTKQTLASTILFAKVLAWIRQWAAELLKKQITLTYWNSEEPDR